MLLTLIVPTVLARSCLFSTQKGQNATTTGFLCYAGLVYFLPRKASPLPRLAFCVTLVLSIFSSERLECYQYWLYMLSWSCLFVSSERLQRYQYWLYVLRCSYLFYSQRCYNATNTGFMCYVVLIYFIPRDATTLPILASCVMLVLSILSPERLQCYQDLPRLLCSLELSWGCEENT